MAKRAARTKPKFKFDEEKYAQLKEKVLGLNTDHAELIQRGLFCRVTAHLFPEMLWLVQAIDHLRGDDPDEIDMPTSLAPIEDGSET